MMLKCDYCTEKVEQDQLWIISVEGKDRVVCFDHNPTLTRRSSQEEHIKPFEQTVEGVL